MTNISERLNYPIYYINLERSPERSLFMEQQFKQYEIKNYYRVNAIDYTQISNLYIGNTNDDIIKQYVNKCQQFTNRPDVIEGRTRQGEVACALSHFKAIIEAYNNNENYAIIMEDDVMLDKFSISNFNLKKLVDTIQIPWYLIQLQCINIITLKRIMYGEYDLDHDLPPDLCRCHDINNRSSAGVYLISRDGMKYIIDHFYNLEENKITLDGPMCASDHILYSIPYTYLCKVPLFYNNDEMFTSCISGQTNPVEKMYRQLIDKFIIYYNKNKSKY